MVGLSVYEVLRKLADAALAEPRGPGKKLKTKKVKMLKAHSRRHINKTVVIGNTVFPFDKDGNTSVPNNGRNQSDFDVLLRIPGMVDKREPTKAERIAAERAAKVKARELEIARNNELAEEAARKHALVELTRETEAAGGYDFELKELEAVVEQETPDPVQPEVRLETKPEESAGGEVVPVGTSKKKGRPKKKSETTKE